MSEPRGMMACVRGWQPTALIIKENRKVIKIEVDMKCIGCAHSEVGEDCCMELRCTKHDVAVRDDALCGDWEMSKECDDFHYLNPVILGVCDEQTS